MSTRTPRRPADHLPTADEIFSAGELGDPGLIARGKEAAGMHLRAIERINEKAREQGRDENGLLQSELRAVEAHLDHVEELQDLIEKNEAAGPPKRTLISSGDDTTKVRHGRSLRSNKFTDLPRCGGSSVEEAGEWLRNLIIGRQEQRAQGESVGAAGGFAVPEPHAAVILDRARTQAQVANAGADIVPLESRTLTIAKVETDPAPSWRGENVQIPESDATFGEVVFEAKSLAVVTRISRELLEDAPNVEEVLTNSLAAAFALEFDRVSLYGAGTATEPRGLKNVAGLPSTDLGANGAAPANYNFLGRAIQRVRTRNYTPTGVILAERTEADLGLLTGTDNQPMQAPAYVAAVPRYATGQVPTNLALGTGTNLSELYVGDFSKLHLGVRTSFGVLVLRERYADFGQVGIVAWLRGDVQVSRIDAFERVGGIAATA